MTKEQYLKSIETGYLQLTSWQKFFHFSILIFLSTVPLVLLICHFVAFVKGDATTYVPEETLFIIIPSLLACLFYWIQKNRLRFKIVETTLDWSAITALIEQAATELKWHAHLNHKNVYVAKTDPGFFSGSWGEQITILFHQTNVYINSICDPDKHSSVVSFGRNAENEFRIIDKIKNDSSKFHEDTSG